ncbi:O-acetyltransferase [Natrialba magadii ATCC 43099]|uniref:O-acetyltransferase n=1 Tax=Natrialba magadii (strain ATCC 43099 / DSM 3394 / CCM 3739 / CIP 104546 / IAM 13178 / JCM 8861 / NBRC 102185 / NCIMB 2190 / MS3) TaxID=547559 RepID=D3SWF0_NATMM|nr:acyltransferase [Natrialba magadii]ADD03742.1 O-acetyltransferase [Natrialba magadii ATCC 43099]ELY33798.1 O-acetyltransferase [Natrialba magadii ATCC 43099]
MTEDPRDRFDEWEQPEIRDGELTEYNWVVHKPEGLELAKYVDIGAFTVINAHAGILIESGVQIGPHCDIHSNSTIDGEEGPIVIRDGARIGSHTTILPNVEIGENALVGSHSLVCEDVPPGEFVTGVPATLKE